MQLTTMAMLQSMLMQVQAAENGRSLLQSTMMVQTSSSRSTTLLKEGVPSEDNLEGFTLKHDNALTKSRRSLLKMMQMKFIASATRFAGKIISRCMVNAMKSSELASSQRTWKIRGTTDHNRANNARVDYVFYRSNNTYCRVHPGTKRKNDAQLNIASTSTCSRAVQAYEVAPNPMTLQQAVQIPVIDKMGKAEAWQQLSQREEAEFDVTEHDPFKWWLFLSNLGDKTEEAFRDGITGVHVRKEENRIGLRIMYTDSSVQWVILTPSRNTCKTRLATSFDEET